VITTDAEYEAALARCWELFDGDSDELQRLVVAIEEYEDRLFPMSSSEAAV
jgi:hypothetical protein